MWTILHVFWENFNQFKEKYFHCFSDHAIPQMQKYSIDSTNNIPNTMERICLSILTVQNIQC